MNDTTASETGSSTGDRQATKDAASPGTGRARRSAGAEPVRAGDASGSLRWTRGVASVVASRGFLVAVLLIFAGQASLVAATTRRSIYDQGYHLSAIEAFSHQLSPWGTQPLDAGPVGDIERYGSYLYHYLLSFPWRLTTSWDYDHRVLLLRLIGVVMVTGALLAVYFLGRRVGLSRAAANMVVLVVSATPLLVFLAGSVNYDNHPHPSRGDVHACGGAPVRRR